ncbi:MAG TPA: hypothetical protein PLD57_09110 [Aggregatilineales bacterium]|nr:hypothetical protein [Aggregatilineales bacterium]HPV07219.1 hypothetical protein [Aggregatilineales bacterium]HQE18523.1 hypothetical protein [Aggregatilineales bacterium]
MSDHRSRRAILTLLFVLAAAAVVLGACRALPGGAPTPTPRIIRVSPTPGGEVAGAAGTPTPTPYIIYVTATPEGAGPPPEPTPTPYIIYVTATPEGYVPPGVEPTITPYIVYVTATPLRVGPFGATPGLGGDALPEPTLDISGITQVPTLAPTEPGVLPSPTPTLAVTPTPAASPTPTATPVIPRPREGALYSERLGINFISSAQHETDDERFHRGIDAGAGWDRFPIYWSEIEQQPNNYNWALYDNTVRNDVIYGLHTEAILLGFPDIYRGEGAVPGHIHQPIFADGSDTPAPGKQLNPDNAWAEFVFHAVERYKPGGVLAQREGWPEGAGVRVWEVWNEPDFTLFWQGSVEDYARLLKVAYIAARQADPEAQIMIGGLVLFEQPDFIYRLLDIYKNDEQPVEGRYPFDMVALHAYSHPSDSFYAIQRLETLLATHGLGDIPIWLNESGVAVWDDYPGPQWATRPDQIVWRASMQEQASYIIQNATFAILGGADKLFHFQLYDDCGNQPAGTTFPPHDGSLCEDGAACWGDALGLVRNRADNLCFNQHPEPGTERPAYRAYRVVAEVFGDSPVIPLTGYTQNGRQRMIFSKPDTQQIITVVWDESGQAGEVAIPARGEQAEMILPSGERQIITPAPDGAYHFPLQPATNRAHNGDPAAGYMIGGSPVILIEPMGDPIVTVLPLLDVTRTAALVKWRASDPSQIVRYEIYYRDDTSGRNEWVRWIEADQPGESLFTPNAQRSYSFFARGLRVDGQWTADAPYAQSWTAIE